MFCRCGTKDADRDNDMDCHDGYPADMTKIKPSICRCGMANDDMDHNGIEDCISGCPGDMQDYSGNVWLWHTQYR